MGAVPGMLSHSVISPGANYFAVLLGAIAGGFLGRSIGDRRAVGLRFQAQMALHQLQFESRLVPPLAAPAVRPAAPAPAPAAAPTPAVSAPVAPPPVVAPPPAPPASAPASPVAAPPTFAPATSAPAPARLVPASAPATAPAVPAVGTEQIAATLSALPRLVEPPALPPLSQLTPPLSGDSRGY
jgi:hypothetical protein